MLAMNMLPTPQAADGFKATAGQSQASITSLIQEMLPTPMARDYRSGFKEGSQAMQERQEHSRGVNLHETIQRKTGKNFQLNPRFVAEMMGFPENWTELPFLPGADNPSGHSEMP
jgi:hypothetical protein